MSLRPVYVVALCLIGAVSSFAATPAEKLTKKSRSWFRTDEAHRVLANVLAWQTRHGDWPKNIDTTKRPIESQKKVAGTFDNGATIGELRLLGHAFQATRTKAYETAFLRGLDHLLAAQYPHGGWPQSYPLSAGYPRHITFNDGTMIRVMELLQDVAHDEVFDFVQPHRRHAAANAVTLGIKCILECQIVVDRQRTVWCAQHHAETLAPVLARSYEHPSLSGCESAGVLRFLMRLQDPSPEVIRCVKAGVAWFESSKILGYRYQRERQPSLQPKRDAAPLWARFYEIESNRPIFSDRDGVLKFNLQEIGIERRTGYTWYGNWGQSVLNDFRKWPHR